MIDKSLLPIPPTSLNQQTADMGDPERMIREKLLLREAQLSQAQRMAGMASWEWYFGDTQIRWSPEMYMNPTKLPSIWIV